MGIVKENKHKIVLEMLYRLFLNIYFTTGFAKQNKVQQMKEELLYGLLEELVSFPKETAWIEFKMGAGSITNEQIGEYISAMSNGATVNNKPFGYMVWGVHDDTHEIKGTNFRFTDAKQGNQD